MSTQKVKNPAAMLQGFPLYFSRLSFHNIITQILQKLVPGVLILHIIQRAFFAALIVMSPHVLRRKVIFVQKPCAQPNQRLVSGVCKFAVGLKITALD